MTALTRPLAALHRIPRPRFPDRSRPQTEARPATPEVRTGQGKILTGLGRSSVTAVTGLVIVTAAASFTESYRALYEWASHHGVAGFWAAIWPLQIDTFIAVGELALVAALVYGWSRKVRASWWAITLAGLAVSVAGNVGHVAAAQLDRAAGARGLARGYQNLRHDDVVLERRQSGGLPLPAHDRRQIRQRIVFFGRQRLQRAGFLLPARQPYAQRVAAGRDGVPALAVDLEILAVERPVPRGLNDALRFGILD